MTVQGMTKPDDDDHYYAAPRSTDPTARDRDEAEAVDPDEVHEVRYRLEPQDAEAFRKAHQQAITGGSSLASKPPPKSWRSGGRLAFAVGIIALGIYLLNSGMQGGGGPGLSPWLPIELLMGLGVSMGLLMLLGWRVRRQQRRAGRQLVNVPEQWLRITWAGVEGTSGDGSRSWRPWETVPKVVMTEAVVLLYITSPKSDRPVALTVPRRAFASDEASTAFGKAARYWSATAARESLASADGFPSRGIPEGGTRLRYELDESERWAQARANRPLVPGARRGAAITTLLTAGCLLVVAWNAPDALGGGGRAVAAMFRGGFALLGVVVFGHFARTTWRLSLFGPRPDSTSAGPVELAAGPAELTMHTARGETGTPWSRLYAVKADNRFVHLTHRSYDREHPVGETLCIPLRAFASVEARETFVAEVGRWIAQGTPSN